MNLFGIFLLIFVSMPAQASILEECGSYEADGFLVKEKNRIFLLLERKSQSEIKIDIGSYAKKLKYRIGTNVTIKFSISKPCSFTCEGKFLEIVKSLEPFENPRSFLFPKPRPYHLQKCSQ